MIELNLKNIILNADFSPIYSGQTESEIISLLGKPTDRFDSKTGSIILAYGGYEFALWDNELHYFQNDNFKTNDTDWILFQNNYFKINPWLIPTDKDISMREVILLLKEEKVKFNIENQKSDGKELRVGEVKFLELSNGVRLMFENETTNFELNKKGEIIKQTEIIYENEMDFVLNSISFDQF